MESQKTVVVRRTGDSADRISIPMLERTNGTLILYYYKCQ